MNILIPMAGANQRFKAAGYSEIKPLINMAGKPMIQWAVETLGLEGNYIFILNSNNGETDVLKRLLRRITNNPTIIEIDYLTQGPASTCLLAKEFINNNEPLLIANCDQIMEWDSSKFQQAITDFPYDGLVVTYPSSTNKNSYVRLDEDEFAVEFAEKKVISNYSLNGIHFWKNGSDFVMSAERMIAKGLKTNNEYYISTSFNELLLEGKKIITYHIHETAHWAVGTPEDLKYYMELHYGYS
jgi:dTDP-glucose pyrophosphorylase